MWLRLRVAEPISLDADSIRVARMSHAGAEGPGGRGLLVLSVWQAEPVTGGRERVASWWRPRRCPAKHKGPSRSNSGTEAARAPPSRYGGGERGDGGSGQDGADEGEDAASGLGRVAQRLRGWDATFREAPFQDMMEAQPPPPSRWAERRLEPPRNPCTRWPQEPESERGE